jgi:hypothetical protein
VIRCGSGICHVGHYILPGRMASIHQNGAHACVGKVGQLYYVDSVYNSTRFDNKCLLTLTVSFLAAQTGKVSANGAYSKRPRCSRTKSIRIASFVWFPTRQG